MIKIQQALRAPKDKDAGRYKYRSAEDLYEQIKPLLESELQITTDLCDIAGRVFVKATAKYKSWSSNGYAELESNPKGMSAGQATGAATSYAIKYALCMLFLVDNGEDLDSQEKHLPGSTDQDTGKKLLNQKMRDKGMGNEQRVEFFMNYSKAGMNPKEMLDNFESLYEGFVANKK